MLFLIVLMVAACGGDEAIDAGTDGSDTGDGAGDATMPSIAGQWVLSRLEVDATEVAPPIDGNGQTLAPEMEIELGRISGSGGCNQFGGMISIDGGSVSIAELAITEMACMPVEIMTFETTYVTALTSVTEWTADPNGIAFTGDQVRIEFVPAPPVEHSMLEGTAWELDSIYSGEGVERAVSSTDRSAPPAELVITDQSATLSTEDCSAVSFAVVYEPGRDGNFRVDDDIALDCDNANMKAAWIGISEASGYMVFENRLTFIGLPGETVGFIARG